MMAIGIARPVKVRIARINHPLTVLRKVLVSALVAIGVCRRRCVRITTIVVMVALPTPRLVLVTTVMISMAPIIGGGSHRQRHAQANRQRKSSRKYPFPFHHSCISLCRGPRIETESPAPALHREGAINRAAGSVSIWSPPRLSRGAVADAIADHLELIPA